MRNLLKKELKLATSPLAWFFLLFSLMTLLPGYPILMGCFFICLGQFQSFQGAREANDTLYTALLPVRKRDTVAAKYLTVCFFQGLAFLMMALLTALRMTVLSGSAVYASNAMMNANPVFLAFALLVFAAFNLLFLGGFFRTAYRIGRPFLAFGVAAFVLICVAESLHHFPALRFLNTPAGERMGLQWAILLIALLLYVIITLLSERASETRFERIDL